MKPAKPRHEVCKLCGKPSKELICRACKEKLRGESLRRKFEAEKGGKEP